MKNFINENFQNQTAQRLLKQWTKACRKRESKTEKNFNKKVKWFKTSWIEKQRYDLISFLLPFK